MIKKEDIVEIGKFQKTHALKGELNALLDVEPDYAFDGNPLIVSVDGIFVPFYPESVRPKGSESYLVKLRDIDSQQDAAMFVNKAIYGLRSDLADYFDDPDAELTADFVGFRIVDSSLGEIGTVTDIEEKATTRPKCSSSSGPTPAIRSTSPWPKSSSTPSTTTARS